MEDYIYLIFLVAWVLFALYRRSQKKSGASAKRATGPQQEQDMKPVTTLEEILFGGKETPAPATPQRTPSWMEEGSFQAEMEETSFEKEYSNRGIKSVEVPSRYEISDEIKRSEIQQDEISDSDKKKEEPDELFDLRKAVIYSEILNRPYI